MAPPDEEQRAIECGPLAARVHGLLFDAVDYTKGGVERFGCAAKSLREEFRLQCARLSAQRIEGAVDRRLLGAALVQRL